MSIPKLDFLIGGVGGQGALTASDILAEVGMFAGYDVKKSEVHGFSQRGGVVESHVRWGNEGLSTLGEQGRIDVLLALEMLEGARWASYLKPGGLAIVSRQELMPISVSSGDAHYPPTETLEQVVRGVTDRFHFVDALTIAEDLGNSRASNTAVLGFLSTFLEVPEEVWLRVIRRRVPSKHVTVNERAFAAGRELRGT
ncbi:MAG: indolepyruvate oxidoreductase subunit beta [Chloroflexi bacterium]|nr:indolepyruvate oxidoreductase subunit beta [Chloroflexota bacterium]